ncbi:MAG: hypothetical protein ACE14T_03160 [Syntrophales bacterium]
MKRVQIFIVSTLLVACVFYPALVHSQTGGPAGQSDTRSGWYCPYCGSYMGPGYGGGYGMGPGMMGPGYGRGYGMGPGMMGPGYGGGYGMGPGYGYGPQYRQPSKPLEEKDAKVEVEDYLKATRNPNLKMGSVTDKGSAFEVEILTKDNSIVDKVLVDKNTGWMKSEY